MDMLQRVLNAAARVVTGTRKFDRGLGHNLHITLLYVLRLRFVNVLINGSSSTSRYCTTSFTGLTSPIGCSSSWQ